MNFTGAKEILLETDSEGNERINRINYEICVLTALRERLCCKEIWVVGANRYRGRGVMIYWHVEKNSTCIYSQRAAK